ncbi:MAG: PD-(D/E)XK nuclease family protein [Halieaceae bacterium]|nr:PD-(D/E)XK nuclease family protein [Halieaceae bacterium]
MLQPLYDIDVILPYVSEGSVFVTPNERLARAISHAFDAQQLNQGVEAWVKISVISLNRLFELWLDDAGFVPCLGSEKAQYLWEQMIRRSMPDDHTSGWLNPKALAAEGYKAYDLMCHYELASDQSFESSMSTDSDCATFYQWVQVFELQLVEQGWVTQAQQWQALAACDLKLADTLTMVDFDTITPLQLAACKRVSSGVQLVRSASTQGVDDTKASGYAFQDIDDQLSQVAQWAHEHHKSESNQRLGIVVPDLNSQRERLEYHLRRAFGLEHKDYASLPVNFSAGVAASDVALINAALSTLKLAAGRLEPIELLALVRSPYVELCGSHHEYLALRNALNELAPLKLGHSELLLIFEHMKARLPDPAMARWWLKSRLEWKGTTCFDCIISWEHILQCAGWPGSRGLDSVEYQAFKLWQRTLRDLASWDTLQPKWAIAEILQLLEFSLDKVVFQPETKDQNIQVLGTLEAAGLHFDQMIVLDSIAGHFPERIAMSPFLPKHLQRAYRMPRANEDQEYQLAQGLLEGMAARSRGIRFCYVALADESKVSITPILAQLEQTLAGVQKLEPAAIPADWQVTVESRGEALPKRPSDFEGGAYRLAMHALCPMQAYARYRLDIPDDASCEDGLSAKEQGQLLHRSMELLWRDKGQLDQIEESNIALVVTEALQSISSARKALLSDLAILAEQQRLEAAITAWLEVESQRPAFTVLEHERDTEMTLKGRKFKFRLDRLDALGDDHTVILDYKSTAPSTSTWLDGRLEQAQLPLYALALGEQVKGIAYAQISSTKPAKLVGASKFGFGKGIKVIEDWAEQTRAWEHALLGMIDELEAGDASVRPSTKACRYCDFASLCRTRAAADDEDTSDE